MSRTSKSRAALPVALLTMTACFDFSAVEIAGVGEKCGRDADQYCDDDQRLHCRNGICVRLAPGELGESCDERSTCGQRLRCWNNRCVDSCEGVLCSNRGTCNNGDGTPRCECVPGYIDDDLECVGQLGQNCSDEIRCSSAFACTNGVCVDGCSVVDCGRNASCSTASGVATCQCDSGYVPSSTSCVLATCSPATHASTACDAGHLYWYDSCGAREDQIENCGSRGCTSNACNAIGWLARDISFAGYNFGDFNVTTNGQLIAVGSATATHAVALQRWDNGWAEFPSGSSTITPSNASFGSRVILAADGRPYVTYSAVFEVEHEFDSSEVYLHYWTGNTWSGLGDSALMDPLIFVPG